MKLWRFQQPHRNAAALIQANNNNNNNTSKQRETDTPGRLLGSRIPALHGRLLRRAPVRFKGALVGARWCLVLQHLPVGVVRLSGTSRAGHRERQHGRHLKRRSFWAYGELVFYVLRSSARLRAPEYKQTDIIRNPRGQVDTIVYRKPHTHFGMLEGEDSLRPHPPREQAVTLRSK